MIELIVMLHVYTTSENDFQIDIMLHVKPGFEKTLDSLPFNLCEICQMSMMMSRFETSSGLFPNFENSLLKCYSRAFCLF